MFNKDKRRGSRRYIKNNENNKSSENIKIKLARATKMTIVGDGERKVRRNVTKLNEINLHIKNREWTKRNFFEAGSGNYSNCFRN